MPCRSVETRSVGQLFFSLIETVRFQTVAHIERLADAGLQRSRIVGREIAADDFVAGEAECTAQAVVEVFAYCQLMFDSEVDTAVVHRACVGLAGLVAAERWSIFAFDILNEVVCILVEDIDFCAELTVEDIEVDT